MDYITKDGITKRDKWDKPSKQKTLKLPDFDLYDALCAQTDPELFFPDKVENQYSHLAKQICVQCPVRIQCLTWALQNDEEFGIWGGFSPKERNEIKRKGVKNLASIPIKAVTINKPEKRRR